MDDALEEEGLCELVEVDITDLSDAVAVEGRGKVMDGDGARDDVDLVASEFAGVKGHSCGEYA